MRLAFDSVGVAMPSRPVVTATITFVAVPWRDADYDVILNLIAPARASADNGGLSDAGGTSGASAADVFARAPGGFLLHVHSSAMVGQESWRTGRRDPGQAWGPGTSEVWAPGLPFWIRASSLLILIFLRG